MIFMYNYFLKIKNKKEYKKNIKIDFLYYF